MPFCNTAEEIKSDETHLYINEDSRCYTLGSRKEYFKIQV